MTSPQNFSFSLPPALALDDLYKQQNMQHGRTGKPVALAKKGEAPPLHGGLHDLCLACCGVSHACLDAAALRQRRLRHVCQRENYPHRSASRAQLHTLSSAAPGASDDTPSGRAARFLWRLRCRAPAHTNEVT